MTVTRLEARKEQKKSHPIVVYFRNQRVEEAKYTKCGQIVIPRRLHTKLRVTSLTIFGMESAGYYKLPKFGKYATKVVTYLGQMAGHNQLPAGVEAIALNFK